MPYRVEILQGFSFSASNVISQNKNLHKTITQGANASQKKEIYGISD
jgi:hypothetical protein